MDLRVTRCSASRCCGALWVARLVCDTGGERRDVRDAGRRVRDEGQLVVSDWLNE